MWRAVALALGICLGNAALAETPVVLGAEGLQRLADEALRAGYAEQALDYVEALLARDPDDTTALIIKARALRALGRYPESEAVARLAWAKAETNPAKFGAAMTLAQALSLQDRRTAAQLWLRAAVELAPNDRARAIAERDFSFVRSQNPLNLQFDLTLQPSSNVNNGARDPLFEFLGLPFLLSGDALALSGVEGGIGVSGFYRLSQTETRQTDLRFALSQQGVWLSPEAQEQAPNARNSDYAFAAIETGLTQRYFLPDSGTTVTASLSWGHNWYSGKSLSDYLAFDLGSERGIAPGVTMTLGTSVDWQVPVGAAQNDSVTVGVSSSVQAIQKNGDSLRLSFRIGDTASDVADSEFAAMSFGLDWQRARPVWGLGIGAAIGFEARDYPVSFYSFDGRHDRKVTASLSASLTEYEYLGFTPVMTLSAARNVSNVAIYDTETLGLNISVKSSF